MPLLTYANKTNVNPVVNRETQATAQDFNDIKTSVNAIYNGVSTEFIPYKTLTGEFGDSPFRYDVANNKVISSVTLEVPPGTIQVGEGLEISAAGVLQINRSRLTGFQYLNTLYQFDDTGSYPPFWIELESEENLIVFSDDSSPTSLTGTNTLTASNNEIINHLIFKTNPDSVLTGVRFELVAQSTGEPIFYFPTKSDWENNQGQDLTADNSGLIIIDIDETPIALLQDEIVINNYKVDSGILLGNGIDTPYLEIIRQKGTFYNLLTEKITNATKEPTGFLLDNITGEIDLESSEILFDNGTRTFTIQPKAPKTEFTVIQNGVLYTFDSAQQIVIDDIEGVHYLYFDEGVLSKTTTFDINTIYSKVFISVIYWDFTNQQQIYLGEERHGCKMDGHTHARLHQKDGSIFLSGMGLADFIIGDGNSNANAQFSVASGNIKDEDILLNRSSVATSVGLPVFYKSGATGVWRREFNTAFSVLTTGTGRLAWNEFTGTIWQKTEVPNNDFVLYHIFATNDINYPYFSIMGQNTYGNISTARNGANEEINNLITNGLPFAEFVALGTIIFQTADGYSNTIKGRIRTTNDENYVDWRYSEISPSGVTTVEHNSLSNLQGGTTGEYYHLTEVESINVNNLSGINTGDVTLSSDDPTQESLDLTGQELTANQATTTTDGVMSSEDKLKLDNLSGNGVGDHWVSGLEITESDPKAQTVDYTAGTYLINGSLKTIVSGGVYDLENGYLGVNHYTGLTSYQHKFVIIYVDDDLVIKSLGGPATEKDEIPDLPICPDDSVCISLVEIRVDSNSIPKDIDDKRITDTRNVPSFNTDELVSCSPDDITTGYLFDKLSNNGNVTFTIENVGGSETIKADASTGSTLPSLTVTADENIDGFDVSTLGPQGILYTNIPANRELRSLIGGVDNQILIITNIATNTLKVKHQTGTYQTIRTEGSADKTFGDYGGCTLVYHASTGYWYTTGIIL